MTPKEVTTDRRIISLIEKYEMRLKSGTESPLGIEEIKHYRPMDSFANAPYQDSRTRPGELIPMKEMINEEQYKKLISSPKTTQPKGENSLLKFNPSAS